MMRVCIVGGGIAGLGLAGFLEQRGVEPVVVEQAEEWDRVGYGIGLWGNGIRLLERLGVADVAATKGMTLGRFQIRKPGGTQVTEFELEQEDDDGLGFVGIHRADLHAALREAVPNDRIRMDTTVKAVDEQDEAVVVMFADGSTETFDLVVGADGIHSTVREECFDDWEVEDCSTVVWSFWAPSDIVIPAGTTSMWAPGTEAFMTHIIGRGLVNIATTMPREDTPEPPALNQLEQTAEQLGWVLPEIVDAVDTDDLFYDRNKRVKAGSWTTDRIVLIGDAAHAVHPISGLGASLALEDAYVLADELDGVSEDTPASALKRYESRRRDRVKRFQRVERMTERVIFADSRVVTWLLNAVVKWTPLMEWYFQRQATKLSNAVDGQI